MPRTNRGGYFWLGKKTEVILAGERITIVDTPRFFSKRPGYVHNDHLAFLDEHVEAFLDGVNPIPYLLGEFPELSEPQAEGIIAWWLRRNAPRQGGDNGRGAFGR